MQQRPRRQREKRGQELTPVRTVHSGHTLSTLRRLWSTTSRSWNSPHFYKMSEVHRHGVSVDKSVYPSVRLRTDEQLWWTGTNREVACWEQGSTGCNINLTLHITDECFLNYSKQKVPGVNRLMMCLWLWDSDDSHNWFIEPDRSGRRWWMG